MINSIFDEMRIVRIIKGGTWYKTKKRGWLRPDHYNSYLGYGFDPEVIKIEMSKTIKEFEEEHIEENQNEFF